jgi:hypothetical protein
MLATVGVSQAGQTPASVSCATFIMQVQDGRVQMPGTISLAR